MSEPLLIVVCDDHEKRRDEWIEEIEAVAVLQGGSATVERFEKKEAFQEAFGTLKHRRAEARRDGATLGDPTLFDRADVLVVDYSLEAFEEGEEYLTGALVAYLARCYSSCGVIVGVNQHGENPFDLTLTGDLSSFADVDVGGRQLGNPGLWGPWEKGFRPWAWPFVPDLVERVRRRVELVAPHLDDPVLELLGFDSSDLLASMPRSAVQALEIPGRTVEEITFREIAESASLGLRRGEQAMSDDAVIRIAVARVAKWLETSLLPLQDVLVDAPHLVARNPALLDGDPADGDVWQRTCQVAANHTDAGLLAQLAAHRYEDLWTTRPTWLWPRIGSDDTLPGVRDPWDIPSSELVFCEDLSRFLPRDGARRFVMEVGSNPARWVAGLGHTSAAGESVTYQPARRLAL